MSTNKSRTSLDRDDRPLNKLASNAAMPQRRCDLVRDNLAFCTDVFWTAMRLAAACNQLVTPREASLEPYLETPCNQ
jgi:hypothetical protein